MANIIDYMDWRGDVTFAHSPINEIDGLIFSMLAYIPFDDMLEQGFTEYRSLKEVGSQFFETYPAEEIEKWPQLLKSCSEVLKKMMEVDRFKDLLLCNYVAESDTVSNKPMQFGAITVVIDEGLYYVAYRGTDDTLAGWEEDFIACYMMPVPAQKKASEYLKYVLKNTTGSVYLGGHSKGGNLAVYAAVEEGYKRKKRIARVHNYDGPGFLQEYVEKKEYAEMATIVDNYCPRASVVGMIMFREDDGVIVESSEKGLMQHTGISWQVLGNGFITAESHEDLSLIFSRANKQWINEIGRDERELFIELVFTILREGFDTVTGMKEGFFSTATTIIKSYNHIDKETRKMARKILGQVIKLYTATRKETKKEIKNLEEKVN